MGISRQLSAIRLRCLPVQRVNLLGADVADEERRVIRRQAHPGEDHTCGFCASEAVEVRDAFQLVVADSRAEDRSVSGRIRIEINLLAVARPGRRIHRSPGQLRPVPRGSVEQHDRLRIGRQCRDIPAVGRESASVSPPPRRMTCERKDCGAFYVTR